MLQGSFVSPEPGVQGLLAGRPLEQPPLRVERKPPAGARHAVFLLSDDR